MIYSKTRTVVLAALLVLVALSIAAVLAAELPFGDRGTAGAPDDDRASSPEEVGEPRGHGLVLHLPTGNDALLHGDRASFYQALDATIPGLRPQGWMGGQYGLVRNPAGSPVGPVFTRVHQGIDIRPVHLDPRGVPLDTVRAIDDGIVVYANRGAGSSSFGRYVVVSHAWDQSSVYSLSAHLEEVWVDVGRPVARGEPIGRMGYTGQGLARHRAHVHLEVALMLNADYDAWHGAFHGSVNVHGRYIGLNLRGVDPEALYLELQEDPDLGFAAFVRSRPVAYRVALPGEHSLDVLQRYPWLAADGLDPAAVSEPGAWLISFTREGVPVEIDRESSLVMKPTVVYVSPEVQQRYLSMGGYVVRGTDGFQLTRNGNAFMALLATRADSVPPWF